MSGLTKLFVGLLVVLSIVLSASTVATVATLDDYQGNIDALTASNASLTTRANTADNALAELQASKTASVNTLSQVLTDVRGKNEELKLDVSKLRAEQVSKDQQIAQINAQNLALTQAVQGAQSAEQTLQSQVSALQQNVELNNEVANLVAQTQITERGRRELAERLREMQQQQQRADRALEDAGLDPAAIARGQTRVQGNAAPINGVVTDKRSLNGRQVVTVSVGSNDKVEKGTEFKVVDRDTGDFLGLVKIEYVDPDESVGYLSGPNPAGVGQGDTVLTSFSN